MSTATQCDDTEHEILTFIQTKKRMDLIVDKGTPRIMKMKTPLAKALDAISCIPFVQNSYEILEGYGEDLIIAGVEAGTLCSPKVDVILEKSIPSPFGKGSQTVLDPSYRSGREIHGEDIDVKSKYYFVKEVLGNAEEFMFPGREISAKLYKLAIYEAGGHFDWHIDSTHSDKHHATLLVALNTSWEGGDLVLRRNGIETHVDLRPQKKSDSGQTRIDLQAVVFFTDTEHRVEPVKSGIRIVLQYDVELKKTQNQWWGNYKEAVWMDRLEKQYSKRMKMGVDAQATDKAALEKVLAIIKELVNNGTQEVAFALQHVYRKSSILGEYLKGSDATLYGALKATGEYDVSLHPVILREAFDVDIYARDENESSVMERSVYRCDISKRDRHIYSNTYPYIVIKYL
jgi:2OG-Fe(II) oxygenase superfamily